MKDQDIRDFLLNEYPQYLTDAGVRALAADPAPISIEDLRLKTIRLSRELALPINSEYELYVREHYSIYILDEYRGEASRQELYAKKKAKDEAEDRDRCIARLRGYHVVDDQGQRLDINKMNLQELRRHVAQLDENQRLKQLSPQAIRQELAAARPKPSRYPGYEILSPDTTAADVTRALRSHEAAKWVRKYSTAQLNARLFGRG